MFYAGKNRHRVQVQLAPRVRRLGVLTAVSCRIVISKDMDSSTTKVRLSYKLTARGGESVKIDNRDSEASDHLITAFHTYTVITLQIGSF